MDLDMLNRLRVNAGKPELTSWKSSKGVLIAAIKKLQDAGFTDALPGANINAQPIADDPKLLEPFKEPEPAEGEEAEDPAEEKPVTKVKTQLARGIETDGYAKHSRKAVQDIRQKEKKDAKAERSEAKKKDKPKGEVDAKKEPEKAARQKAHIAEKKAKREKTGAKVKTVGADEITVAEIARDLGIDPRVARAKMRRHEAKVEKLHTKGQDRWTFPKTAAKELKAILQGSAK